VNRDKLLADYLNSANVLVQELRYLHPDAIDFQPDLPDAWTIRRHAAHLADSEINRFVAVNPELLAALTDEAPFLAESVDWFEAGLETLLGAFLTTRELVYDWLGQADTTSWSAPVSLRLSNGETVERGLEEAIQMLTSHLKAHQDFIERNVNLWEATQEDEQHDGELADDEDD
jgi:hypothetical protein